MSSQKYLILDYETYSEAPLKKVGAFEYASHPSTEVLCCGFAIGTREQLKTASIWCYLPGGHTLQILKRLHSALYDPNIILVAHNALFEQVITRSRFPYDGLITPERWMCTAALSRSIGLPGNLEMAAKALGLSQQKDKQGHRLMLKLSKPKKPSAKDPSTRHQNPEDLKRLYDYCVQDVRTEIDLFLALPEMPDKERKFWVLNQEMNLTGFQVDRPLVQGALSLIDLERKSLDHKIKVLTDDEISSANQRDKLLKWIKERDERVENLQSKTIQDALKLPNLKPDVRAVLTVRQAASKSSTAKYSAFECRSRFDGRARDNTIFFGAHTGREAGTGLQPQNLFRATEKQEDLEAAIPFVKSKDVSTIRAVFDEPMKLYASLLRSSIVAPPGKTLYVGDFSTIEVRVLFWLSGHDKGLDAIRAGKDLYLGMASDIYKIPLEQLTAEYKTGLHKEKRQLGKKVVLGAGFGIGFKKFYDSCVQDGLTISENMAQTAVDRYRKLHAPIPHFWRNMEQAAIAAVRNPGRTYKVGKLVWCLERSGFLTCLLPIGRKIHYFKPKVTLKNSLYGLQDSLSYQTLWKGKTFVSETVWGGVLVENVVQAVARDLLKEALLRFKADAIFTPILEVHDEIVCEGSAKLAPLNIFRFEDIMKRVPEWAEGLPINVEVWQAERYRK